MTSYCRRKPAILYITEFEAAIALTIWIKYTRKKTSFLNKQNRAPKSSSLDELMQEALVDLQQCFFKHASSSVKSLNISNRGNTNQPRSAITTIKPQ